MRVRGAVFHQELLGALVSRIILGSPAVCFAGLRLFLLSWSGVFLVQLAGSWRMFHNFFVLAAAWISGGLSLSDVGL